MNSSSKYNFTNIILNNELKELVYKEIIAAQDPKSPFYLSKLSSYEIYHLELKKLFKKIYNKTPSQTDYLAFVLLLTYPKNKIEKFTTFTELKLAFNNREKESDFVSNGFNHDENMTSTCICSERISWVHLFTNKHSGINIQLGSICNDRYGLISVYDDNYKSTCQKIKKYQEKIREQKECKPEGFYENERQIKKEKNKENKRMKEEIKLMKKEETLTKKLNKELEKTLQILNRKNDFGFYVTGKCMFCKIETIYNKFVDKICICSKCIPNEYKMRKKEILNKIKDTVNICDCSYCESVFISINKNELCCKCIKIITVSKCVFCKEKFCIDKNKNDYYCDVCEDDIIQCISCPSIIYKNISKKQSDRCNDCYRRYISKLKVINCVYCNDNFECPENESWRKTCKSCYKNNLIEYNCQYCKKVFKKLPNETWKKTCIDCYKNSKSKC